MKKLDEKSSLIAVTEILKILDNLLKYVSEFVKKALQVLIIYIGYVCPTSCLRHISALYNRFV